MVELNLTKRQQEIFDFIKRYSARARLPADGARHRQGDRPHLVLDGARASRQPREARPAAARPDQAARDRAARRQGAKAVEPAGLPLVGRVAAGAPMLAEENIEEYVDVPGVAGGDEGEFVLRVAATR